jgi:hypothetical protein
VTLYVSAATRRRRAIVAVVVAAALGLLVGILGTKWTTPSTAERVNTVRTAAADAATRISALTIEYEQGFAGTGVDSIKAGVLDPLVTIDADLQGAMADAPWLTATERAKVVATIASVRSAAQAKVPPADFAKVTDAAATALRDLFHTDAASQ